MAGVEFYQDAADFLARADQALAAEPLLTTVLASVATREAARPGSFAQGVPHWFAVVPEGEGLGGLAMRMAPWAPYPVYVGPMTESAAQSMGEALLRQVPPVVEVNGARPAADLVAGRLAAERGAHVEVAMHLRLFEAAAVNPVTEPEGHLRLATLDDIDVVAEWFDRFHAEADEQAGRPVDPNPPHFGPGELESRIEDGLVFLWVSPAGEVVHLTGRNVPAKGAVRVGPVYTPREHRGQGYAAATVARLTQDLLDGGLRPILFTDQENPTSNALYERLGYAPVADLANLRLVGGSVPG